MALTTTYANKYKEALVNGLINFGSIGVGQGSPHTFKMILMNNSFSFNEDTHQYYGDVINNEMANTVGYSSGYTAGGQSLGTLTVSRNDTDNSISVTFNAISWNFVGGDFGPTLGAIIYDDSTGGTNNSKILICYIHFGTGQTTYDGGYLTVSKGTLKVV